MENKKELKQELGYKFWLRVDDKRADRDLTLSELVKLAKLKYTVVKNQRSLNVIPNLIDVCSIAEVLHTTCEYLAKGKDINASWVSDYYPYIENMQQTDPEKLRIIREMLGMPKKTEDISSSGAKAV